MHLIFNNGRPVNPSGLTMAWSNCAAAKMELKKPKKCERANKRVSTVDFNKVFNGNVRFSRDRRSTEVRFYVIITQE